MIADEEAEILNPLCATEELQIDSTMEYCARWLASIPAAPPDEASRLVHENPLSEFCSENSIPDRPSSSPAASVSNSVTRDRTEARQTTPSHINATPEPEPEILARAPCHRSPCARLRETSKYEKQPRRKTRPDRYDTGRQHRDAAGLSRRERRELRKEKIRSRKEIMNNFYSAATENRQVLMKPALATGAFVNGRGSVSTPLADLTFNELTFPITQKTMPRATSPQPPNGARKRPSGQVQTSPEQPGKHPKEPIVIAEGCPDTPTPGPRKDRATKPKQSQLLNNKNDPDTSPKKDSRPIDTTPRRIIKYVDSGVDTMSQAGSFVPGQADDRPVQLPPAEYQNSEQVNPYVPYNNPLPMYMPQYYAPCYPINGIYSQASLPNPAWAADVPLHYASQQVDAMPTQEWQEHQNRDCFMTPTADFYPSLATELNEFIAESPVHEPEPQFKPDEETKAFWRPNFLR